MNVDSLVWVINPEFKDYTTDDLWFESVIEQKVEMAKMGSSAIKVRVGNREIIVNLKTGMLENDKIKPRSAFLNIGDEDLLNIPELNEPEILSFLQKRFEKGFILTYTGSILLSMNPFDEVKAHGASNRLIKDYVNSVLMETIDQNNALLAKDPEATPIAHSILIGGESGSGKTECSKMILRSFAAAHIMKAGDTTSEKNEMIAMKNDLVNKILLGNKVLESFGNARTMTTANSSRFGKLVELLFNGDGDICAGNIRTHLLESSRIFTQQVNERNFNIFYQLLVGANEQERKDWKVKSANSFYYTNQGGEISRDEAMYYAKHYQELLSALDKLGLKREEVSELFRLMVGVLYLGEVSFEGYLEAKPGSEPSHDNMKIVSALLGIEKPDLDALFTTKTLMAANNEAIKVQLNPNQSSIVRDAVVKIIYRHAFDWVANEINIRLRTGVDSYMYSIYIMDMFGFDAFKRNSIDQLVINYVNEALQQQFNDHVFKEEMKLYEMEKIKYDKVRYSDNKNNVDLIGNGIFKILDDQCRLPNPTDKRFVAQIYKEFESNPLLTANKVQQRESKFAITHFAGIVEYTADDFIVKNIDNVPATTQKTLIASTNSVLALFSTIGADNITMTQVKQSTTLKTTGNSFKKKISLAKVVGSVIVANRVSKPSEDGPIKKGPTSMVHQVKTELNILIRKIENTAPHYIRCIKPFDRSLMEGVTGSQQHLLRKRSSAVMSLKTKFNQFKVAQQLQYGGVFEAVRIARSGFRARMAYADFYSRYRTVAKEIDELYSDPLRLDPDTTPEQAKELAISLVRILSASTEKRSTPKLNKKSSFVFGSSPSEWALSASGSYDEYHLQQINALKVGSGGIIEMDQLQFGETKIFLKKREYDYLEIFRNRCLSNYILLIQATWRCFSYTRRYKLMKQYSVVCQRIMRGYLARKLVTMMKILLISAVTLQRRFRRRKFRKGIALIQAVIRSFLAKKIVKLLQERRAKLLSAYGVLMSARELRMHRRRLQASKKSTATAALLSIFKRKNLNIPPPEIRSEERTYEDENLVEAMTNVLKQMDNQIDAHLLETVSFTSMLVALQVSNQGLNNDNIKSRLTKIMKLLKPAEYLLKPETSNSSLGSIFSANKSAPQEANDNDDDKLLSANHPAFAQIQYVLHKIHKLEAVMIREVQLLITSYDHAMLKDEDEDTTQVLTPAMVSARRFYKIVSALQDNIGCVRKHYEVYIQQFCEEYGDDSNFYKAFPNQSTYNKALVGVINQMRKLPEESTKPIKREESRSKQTCPLVVEWDIEQEERDRQQMIARRLQSIEEANIQDSAILSRLAIVDKHREEISTENLRVVELKGIGYKFNPQAPGISYSLNSFAYLLNGSFLSGRRLTRMVGTKHQTGKVAVYEACVGLTNASFLDVLYNPVQIEQLDSASFTSMMLTCCIMGVTNLHPNHLLVDYGNMATTNTKSSFTYAPLNSIRINGFNTDHTFAESFLDLHNPVKQKITQENMNMLFFLPQMDEQVDPDVRAFLAHHAFRPEEIIAHWLHDLFDQNNRLDALKTSGFTGDELQQLNLPVLLRKGSAMELLKRLRYVCKLFAEKDEDGPSSNRNSRRGATDANNFKPLLHRDVLHDFAPLVSDYYDNERLNSDFAEGIEGITGVVSYAHVYHQAIEAEKRAIMIQKRKQELQKSATQSEANIASNAPQGGKRRSSIATAITGLLTGGDDKRQGKTTDDEYYVNEDGYMERKKDDFFGGGPGMESNPLRSKKTATGMDGEVELDYDVFGNKDEFTSDAMVKERPASVGKGRSGSSPAVRRSNGDAVYGESPMRARMNASKDNTPNGVFAARDDFSATSPLRAAMMNKSSGRKSDVEDSTGETKLKSAVHNHSNQRGSVTSDHQGGRGEDFGAISPLRAAMLAKKAAGGGNPAAPRPSTASKTSGSGDEKHSAAGGNEFSDVSPLRAAMLAKKNNAPEATSNKPDEFSDVSPLRAAMLAKKNNAPEATSNKPDEFSDVSPLRAAMLKKKAEPAHEEKHDKMGGDFNEVSPLRAAMLAKKNADSTTANHSKGDEFSSESPLRAAMKGKTATAGNSDTDNYGVKSKEHHSDAENSKSDAEANAYGVKSRDDFGGVSPLRAAMLAKKKPEETSSHHSDNFSGGNPLSSKITSANTGSEVDNSDPDPQHNYGVREEFGEMSPLRAAMLAKNNNKAPPTPTGSDAERSAKPPKPPAEEVKKEPKSIVEKYGVNQFMHESPLKRRSNPVPKLDLKTRLGGESGPESGTESVAPATPAGGEQTTARSHAESTEGTGTDQHPRSASRGGNPLGQRRASFAMKDGDGANPLNRGRSNNRGSVTGDSVASPPVSRGRGSKHAPVEDVRDRIDKARKSAAFFLKAGSEQVDTADNFEYGALYEGGNDEFGTPASNSPARPTTPGRRDGASMPHKLLPQLTTNFMGKGGDGEGFQEEKKKEEVEVLTLSTPVEVESLEFLKSINFKAIADQLNGTDMKKFCQIIGKNLSFLPIMWFVNINEQQLKFVFKYWLNILVNKKFDQAKLKLLVKEIHLQYTDEDEKIQIDIHKSALLYQLKHHLKVVIKIVTSHDGHGNAGAKRASIASPWRRLSLATPNAARASKANPLLGEDDGTVTFTEYNTTDYEFHNKRGIANAPDDTLDSDDEILPSDHNLKERLLKVLFSCANLMTSHDFKEAKIKVELVKNIVHHICSAEHDYIDGRLVKSFGAILLEFPGLAKIGEVVADRKAFTKDKMIIHRILAHSLVDRYIDVLMSLLRNHPDMLWLSDPDTDMLPCDRIKKIPETKYYKYRLLTKFVNFAAKLPSAVGAGSIFSNHRGEEELVIRAAQHGLPATEAELKSRRFDIMKKVHSPFIPSHHSNHHFSSAAPGPNAVKDETLMWRLLVEEINGDEKMRNRAWGTYVVLTESLKERMTVAMSEGRSATEIENLLWKSLDLEGRSMDKCAVYHVNQKTLDKSKIVADMKDNWAPGTFEKKYREATAGHHQPKGHGVSFPTEEAKQDGGLKKDKKSFLSSKDRKPSLFSSPSFLRPKKPKAQAQEEHF